MTAQLLALAAGIDVGQRFLDVGFAPSGTNSEFPTLQEGSLLLSSG